MQVLADIVVVFFYSVVFLASLIIVTAACFVGYLELNGYFEEIKQDRAEAEEYRRESN